VLRRNAEAPALFRCCQSEDPASPLAIRSPLLIRPTAPAGLLATERQLLLDQIGEQRAKLAVLDRQRAQREAERATDAATITVLNVSADSIDRSEPLPDSGDKANPANSGSASEPQGRELVYPAHVLLNRSAMAVDGRDAPLSPGMAVTVEIKTGAQRVITYLLSGRRELRLSPGRPSRSTKRRILRLRNAGSSR
jgi:hypothetical protein